MPIHYNCWVYKDDNKNHGSYYVCIYDFKISVVQELKKMHDAVSWKKKIHGKSRDVELWSYKAFPEEELFKWRHKNCKIKVSEIFSKQKEEQTQKLLFLWKILRPNWQHYMCLCINWNKDGGFFWFVHHYINPSFRKVYILWYIVGTV